MHLLGVLAAHTTSALPTIILLNLLSRFYLPPFAAIPISPCGPIFALTGQTGISTHTFVMEQVLTGGYGLSHCKGPISL